MKLRAFCLSVALALICPVRGDEDLHVVQFEKTDIRDVLLYYQTLVGGQVIHSNVLSGNFQLLVKDPVPKEKAIELLEAAFSAQGYCLIQIKPDTIRVCSVGETPYACGVPVVTKVEDLPKRERVILYPYQLKHRDPKELMEKLTQQFTTGTNGLPRFIDDAPSRTVLITAETSVARAAIQLLDVLDKPVAK